MQLPLHPSAVAHSSGIPLFRNTPRNGIVQALRSRELGRSDDFKTSVYNAIVPNKTYDNVTGLPHVYPVRFSPCGRFLVTISRNYADLVVFRIEGGDLRANWPPPTLSRGAEQQRDKHSDETCAFARFFSMHYTVPVANSGETLVADFCFTSSAGRFFILASFTSAQPNDDADGEQTPAQPGGLPAMRACPLLERFTLHLVETETGRVYDRFVLENDFVQLDGHPGVHMRANVLCVLSLRFQTLHVLRVQESVGRFVHERAVGPECHADDAATLARVDVAASPAAAAVDGGDDGDGSDTSDGDLESGLGNGRRRYVPYSGLMQRLLTYVFRSYARKGNTRKFFSAVGKYSALLMLRAQLLDSDHLLLLLGTDPSVGANSARFFVVYCISRGSILHLYEDNSEELLRILELYQDMFHADPEVAAGEKHVLTSLAGAPSRSEAKKRAREVLRALPLRPTMQCGSPYLNRRLYAYELAPSPDAYDQSANTFTSLRTAKVRFRLGGGTRGRHSSGAQTAYLFHPTLPFEMSVISAGVSRHVSFHLSGSREKEILKERSALHAHGGSATI